MAASLSPALIDLLTHMYVSIIDESAGWRLNKMLKAMRGADHSWIIADNITWGTAANLGPNINNRPTCVCVFIRHELRVFENYSSNLDNTQ